MDATSALFGAQAEADFRVACLIPRQDLSGQALGTSMFLAQQCIEKQLKAIVLRLNEAMDLEEGDRFLFELSHSFYPALHTIRKRFVEDLGTPPAPVLRLMDLDASGQAFADNDCAIGHVVGFWKEYAIPGSQIQMSVWRNFLHDRLPQDELDSLNRFVRRSAAILPGAPGSSGSGSRPSEQLTNDFKRPPPMRSVIRDRGMTDAIYSDYVWTPQRRGMQELHDLRVACQDTVFSEVCLGRLGRFSRDVQERAVRRLVTEFAFEAAAMMAYRYMTLYPHSWLGRYPKLLPDGRATPAVYESRADVVLHRIYNETRFSMDLLRGHASKLDELCRLGHEHGYW